MMGSLTSLLSVNLLAGVSGLRLAGWDVAAGRLEPLAGGAAVVVEVRHKRRAVIEPVQGFAHVVGVADGIGAALVAHQPQQPLGQGAGDLGRAGQILVFLLGTPAPGRAPLSPRPGGSGGGGPPRRERPSRCRPAPSPWSSPLGR